jgi:quinol monooxygenase YgiN
MLHVIAHIRAKREHAGAVRAVLTGFVAPTRGEAGCVVYDLFQNLGDPTHFTFVEEWADEGALDAHGQSAHIASGRAKLKDLVEGPAEIVLYSRLA